MYRFIGDEFVPVTTQEPLTVEQFRCISISISDKIANLMIVIKNASRFNEPIDQVIFNTYWDILKVELRTQFGKSDIPFEITNHIDQYRVPPENQKTWRTSFWDICIKYDLFKILYPESLGSLDAQTMLLFKKFFISEAPISWLTLLSSKDQKASH